MRIVKYEHHGNEVSVQEDLKGKHRDHCLCFQSCKLFIPNNREKNCKIANTLFAIDCAFGITTPVWECPRYEKYSGEIANA